MNARVMCYGLTILGLLAMGGGIYGLSRFGWEHESWWWIGVFIGGVWIYGISEIMAGVIYEESGDD